MRAAIVCAVLGFVSLTAPVHAQPVIIPLTPQPERNPPPPPPPSPVPVAPATGSREPGVVFNGQQPGAPGATESGMAPRRDEQETTALPPAQQAR